jgi:putative ATPase
MTAPEFYRPVDRGLEIRIAEKLRELKKLNSGKQ